MLENRRTGSLSDCTRGSSPTHIVTRLEGLVPDPEQRIAQLLDLDYELPDDERVDQLVTLLRERLLPLIERGSTVAGLRSMADDATFARAGIRGPAQEALAAAA
jgi:hypothetical protein